MQEEGLGQTQDTLERSFLRASVTFRAELVEVAIKKKVWVCLLKLLPLDKQETMVE